MAERNAGSFGSLSKASGSQNLCLETYETPYLINYICEESSGIKIILDKEKIKKQKPNN